MKDYERQLKSLIDPTDISLQTKKILERIKSNKSIPKADTVVPYSVNLDDNNGHVFAGNLIVEGDLYVNAHTYIIGDLKVSGVLYGGIHCIPSPTIYKLPGHLKREQLMENRTLKNH